MNKYKIEYNDDKVVTVSAPTAANSRGRLEKVIPGVKKIKSTKRLKS